MTCIFSVNSIVDDISVPVVSLAFYDGLTIYNEWEARNESSFPFPPEALIGTINNHDFNIWQDVFNTGAFNLFSSFLIIFASTNILFALRKLFIIYKRGQLKLNIGIIILFTLTLANTLRLIVLSLDPITSQCVLPYEFATVLNTLSFPLENVSTLLITFYWMSMIDTSTLEVKTFLGGFKVPFYILGFIFIAQEIVSGVLRILGVGAFVLLITITAILYAIFNFGVTTFFFVTGKRVMDHVSELDEEIANRLRKTTIDILLSGAFGSLWSIPALLASLFPGYWRPIPHVTIWFFLYFLLMCVSFMQIRAIRVPKKDSDSSLSLNDTLNSINGRRDRSNRTRPKRNGTSRTRTKTSSSRPTTQTETVKLDTTTEDILSDTESNILTELSSISVENSSLTTTTSDDTSSTTSDDTSSTTSDETNSPTTTTSDDTSSLTTSDDSSTPATTTSEIFITTSEETS
eukprot:TRINITY_DN1583_c0_g1_i2.p1 TRINITY_DN1583_c0_g1~~TRINITY_DN1583_c0_g1_i2.p1  ORF type:complete len:461 (+),score=80.43 TRINITY_DN1583_c0_g1_i2:1505-2887(+)